MQSNDTQENISNRQASFEVDSLAEKLPFRKNLSCFQG